MPKLMNTALLCMDLQHDLVHPDGKIGKSGLAEQVAKRRVLENNARAQQAARKAGVPVGHVRVAFRPDFLDGFRSSPRFQQSKEMGALIDGEWGGEIHEMVKPRDDELVFHKRCVNPFYNTPLLTWLHSKGITSIALGGVVTNMVVESAARYADDAGISVTVLEDCCASPSEEWHEFAVTKILPLFGRVISTDAFIGELG